MASTHHVELLARIAEETDVWLPELEQRHGLKPATNTTGHVEVDLSVFSQIIKECMPDTAIPDSNSDLAELFRRRPDHAFPIQYPRWEDEQRHYIFVLGSDIPRNELAALVSGAFEYWNTRAAAGKYRLEVP